MRKYKQNYANEINENERLLTEIDELKNTLKDTLDQIKNQETTSTMHCATTFNSYPNHFISSSTQKTGHTGIGYHLTRKQIQEEQKKVSLVFNVS